MPAGKREQCIDPLMLEGTGNDLSTVNLCDRLTVLQNRIQPEMDTAIERFNPTCCQQRPSSERFVTCR